MPFKKSSRNLSRNRGPEARTVTGNKNPGKPGGQPSRDTLNSEAENQSIALRNHGALLPARRTSSRKRAHDLEMLHIRDEVAQTREYAQAVVEDQESAHEELTAAGEKTLAGMEELRRTNEEQETSKEQLQSITPNVLNCAGIPILILGSDGRGRFYACRGKQTQPSRHRCRTADRLGALHRIPAGPARRADVICITNATNVQSELRCPDGHWYAMRVIVFWTGEKKLERILITFVDIHEFREGQKALKKAAEESDPTIRVIMVNSMPVISAVDRDGRITTANRPENRMDGYTGTECDGTPVEMIRPWEDGTRFSAELSVGSIKTGDWTLGVAFVTDLEEPWRYRQPLTKYQQQLQNLAAGLIGARANNSWEPARELHDFFSQELAVPSMEISALAHDAPPLDGSFGESLAKIRKKIGHFAEDIHVTSRELHSTTAQGLGIGLAPRQECETFKRRSGHLPSLAGSRRGTTRRVRDNGLGFDLDEARKRGDLGLINMQERVGPVNGTITIRSQSGTGSTVSVCVPREDLQGCRPV